MIPSTPSNHKVGDEELPNPDSSKITSDPKSDGKHERKKDKIRDKTLVENDDTDPDPTEGTSSIAEQPPSK